MLDTENAGDKTALSYAFRPLTQNKYISKNKQSIVTVLRKGRELFPEEEPLISAGTSEKSRLRVLQVSKMAALMEKNGVPSFGELLDIDDPYFILSACWRNIADGILSTTRFAGMLLAYDKKYAVYDIGDGTMEWQVRAESALFCRISEGFCEDDLPSVNGLNRTARRAYRTMRTILPCAPPGSQNRQAYFLHKKRIPSIIDGRYPLLTILVAAMRFQLFI